MVITRENAKLNIEIWWAVDDRPLEHPSVEKGVISKIEEDHFLFDLDNELKDVWGFYDEDPDDFLTTCIVFTSENEAKDWLRKRG